jgi:hypothetical protein
MTTSTQETTRLTGDPAVCSTDWLCVSALLLMTVGVATIWIGTVEQEIALNILGCAVQWGAGGFILGRISKRHNDQAHRRRDTEAPSETETQSRRSVERLVR